MGEHEFRIAVLTLIAAEKSFANHYPCSALFLPVSLQAERERKDRMQADQRAVERPVQLFRQMSDALVTARRQRA
jgi:hypothetical protein